MQKEKTILFLHGFYASGQCVPAVALREAFEGKVAFPEALYEQPSLPWRTYPNGRTVQDMVLSAHREAAA